MVTIRLEPTGRCSLRVVELEDARLKLGARARPHTLILEVASGLLAGNRVRVLTRSAPKGDLQFQEETVRNGIQCH
jgi:hypothetical protein